MQQKHNEIDESHSSNTQTPVNIVWFQSTTLEQEASICYPL